MTKSMAEVLEELWDGGNATGLDGWIGPGRGAGEVDDHAIDTRRRDVEKALSALSAAGFGLVADAGAKALEDAADELTWVRPESSPCGDTESCCGSVESCDAMRPSVFTASPAWLHARAAAVRGEG